jgi:hypothetical protein
MIRFVKYTAAALAGLSFSACASQPDDRQAPAGAECGAPAGWEPVAAAAEHKVLIFGESHGTKEMPDAFARYVCAAAAQGGKTLVLLEFDTSHAGALSDASDAADPHAVLVSEMQPHWSGTDGRSSVAMLDMVERLIALRQGGRDLTILPMQQMIGWPETDSPEELAAWYAQQPPTKTQQMVDSGMAEKIRTESEGYDRTIVLVGGVHARQAELEYLPGVQLMAMLVPDAISLNIIHDGGTAWDQRSDSIGVHKQSRSNRDGIPANAMALSIERLPAYPGDLPAYDGFVSVGPITASEPALPPSDAP